MKILSNDMKHGVSEKVAQAIAGSIIKAQTGLAKKLQSVTKNWQQPQRWIFLYFICLLFGGISMVVLFQTFYSTQTNKSILPKTFSTSIPIYPKLKGFLITREELQKVQQYKLVHPNLEKEMPELYERLNGIEQAFYSQQK